MDIPDINQVGSIASIAGLGTTFVQWIQSWRTANELGAASEAEATIDDYLEWLRRNDHNEILLRLQESDEALSAIRMILAQLLERTDESFLEILAQLTDIDQQLDSVAADVADIKRQLALFAIPSHRPSEYLQFERKYLDEVAREYGRLQMLGVREMRDLRQSLSIAYVSLRLRAAAESETESERAEAVLLKHRLLAIRGPAGSGKSTLLSWLAQQCSAISEGSPWHGGVPFFVPLRRLERSGRPSVGLFVDYTVDRTLWSAQPPHGWIESVLSERRAVLLIDGVDELSHQFRPDFWNWVRELDEQFPGNRICITSRPFPEPSSATADRLWNPPSEFAIADLDELTDDDVRDLITNWHRAVLHSETDPRVRHELTDSSAALPQKLREPSNRRVRELCKNPLLCSLVCALHWREEGYLPSRRVDLYDRCCTMLIEERDIKRKIARPSGPLGYLDLEDKEMILQRLALSMMRNKLGDVEQAYQIEITREEAASWIHPTLAACDERVRGCSADDVLNHLIERSGLLREPAKGYIDFQHRTFQEYLAACAAGALNDAGDLAGRAGDDQWHETIVLAAGTKLGGVPFGNRLVTELLQAGEKQPKHNQLRKTCFALAVACLETARQIDEALRDRVLSKLKEILPPRDNTDARTLSAAGEAVLDHLDYTRWRHKPYRTVAACARTIAAIGTQRAIGMLEDSDGYGSDTRASVLVEVLECPGVHPLRVPRIVSLLRGPAPGIPKSVYPYVERITDLSPLRSRTFLRSIHLNGLRDLEDMSPLGGLPRLNRLSIRSSTRLSDLQPLATLDDLRHLTLGECTALTNIAPIAQIRSLQSVVLMRLPKVDNVDPLAALTELQELTIGHCFSIRDVSFISELTKIERLTIRGLRAVTQYPTFKRLQGLRLLKIFGCADIGDWSTMSELRKLQVLHLGQCDTLRDIAWLSGLSTLRTLAIVSATNLVDVEPLSALNRLTDLDLSGCENIESISVISHLPNLERLSLKNCEKISDWSPVAQHPKLKIIWLGPRESMQLAGKVTARVVLGSSPWSY